MLFLAGLGETAPLIPTVPTSTRVPRAPSNRVRVGWDGRVPAVPRANLVPQRNLQQTTLVAYPTFEPTFPPPASVQRDWQPPEMQMVNGLGESPIQDRVSAATAAVYSVALREIQPFYAWVVSLPPNSRQATMSVVLNKLRSGGGTRVNSTFRSLLSTGMDASVALRRALAKEFAATALSPASNVPLLLASEMSGWREDLDSVREGVNAASNAASNIACNEAVQEYGGGIVEYFGGDADDTEGMLEQTCEGAQRVERVTESSDQRRARLAREQAAAQAAAAAAARQRQSRAAPPVASRRQPARQTVRRRPTLAEQGAAIQQQSWEMADRWGRGMRSRLAEPSAQIKREAPGQLSERDMAIILARRAPAVEFLEPVGQGVGLGKMLLVGGAVLGGYWLWRRRKPPAVVRTARAAEVSV